jgi:hypothetical protein
MNNLVIRKATYEDAEGKGYMHYINLYRSFSMINHKKSLVWSVVLSQ